MTFTEFRLLLLKDRNFAFWKQMHDSASLSRKEIDKISLERVLSIFRYAYENIPFYNKKYTECGIKLEDIKTLQDFQKLPLVTKEEVRLNYQQMIAANDSLDNLVRSGTGGSTGEPLQVWHSPGSIEAILWPILEKNGISYADPYGVVGRGTCSAFHLGISNFLFYPRRYFQLDARQVLTPAAMTEFVRQLNTIKAKYIRGYVGGIQQFAEFCEASGLQIPSLKMIWTMGAPLPESVRTYLSGIYQCPVYSQYGCVEIPALGMECSSQCGLHTFPYARYIEIVDENHKNVETGVQGAVVITNLLEKRFPLIRYFNGDKASFLKESCPCGSSLPLLSYVKGRISDALTFSDGSFFPGEFLTEVFNDYPHAVKSFQFYQYKNGNVALRVVKNTAYEHSDDEVRKVAESMRSAFDGHAPFLLEEVNEIFYDKGKTRYVLREE